MEVSLSVQFVWIMDDFPRSFIVRYCSYNHLREHGRPISILYT
jgi:hypothetical protein